MSRSDDYREWECLGREEESAGCEEQEGRNVDRSEKCKSEN